MLVEHTSGPRTGQVFAVDECFSKLYRQIGGTSSWIGLPISDGYQTPTGARQDFERGYMLWSASTFRCEARGKDGGSTDMTLEARDYRVDVGGTVQVPIYLNNGDNLANMNFTVAYDPSVVRVEGSAAKGNILGSLLFSSNPGEAGLFRGAFAGTTGVSGTGTVAYIQFKAVGAAGAKTPLTLAVSTINQPSGSSPRIRMIHGSITINGGPGGVAVPGDCDGDGKLTASDALCALEMSVKLIPVRIALDADKSGDVTSRDATVILQRIVR